jgi:hypothetical protein
VDSVIEHAQRFDSPEKYAKIGASSRVVVNFCLKASDVCYIQSKVPNVTVLHVEIPSDWSHLTLKFAVLGQDLRWSERSQILQFGSPLIYSPLTGQFVPFPLDKIPRFRTGMLVH